jgi:hypothetical protein
MFAFARKVFDDCKKGSRGNEEEGSPRVPWKGAGGSGFGRGPERAPIPRPGSQKPEVFKVGRYYFTWKESETPKPASEPEVEPEEDPDIAELYRLTDIEEEVGDVKLFLNDTDEETDEYESCQSEPDVLPSQAPRPVILKKIVADNAWKELPFYTDLTGFSPNLISFVLF